MSENIPAAEDTNSPPTKKEPLFQDLGNVFENNDQDPRPTEIESYCVNCGENGITKLLLTRIPHWRDVVIMSFECEHCNFQNNELQFAGAIAEEGCLYTCQISTPDDLNRQLVRSENSSIRIPVIDLELPPSANKRGTLTTIEGLLSAIIDDLSSDQPLRKHTDEKTYNKLEAIIEHLKKLKDGGENFAVEVDDPSGNSYIENLCAPNPDPKLKIRHYTRTREMEIELGLSVPSDDQEAQPPQDTLQQVAVSQQDEGEVNNDIPDVLVFPANCSHCNAPSDTKMHVLNIPHFKEIVIMATSCDVCGYKSSEVKAGGPISPLGKKITLKMEDMEDLSRDILKSETCSLSIPEIDLELMLGTLGGRFTTIEGLLRQVNEELNRGVPFASGDSVQEARRTTFENFMQKLNNVIEGKVFPVHLVLDDPLANSYLQNLYAPDPDPNMQVEFYERTWEQNEGLGLNDMRLENYQEGNNSQEKQS